jgi:predicted RNA-binding protein YlxR (DUF448 family)
MNDRTCIVTREAGSADELIRFVVAPDGTVVPDLKRALPGRGCWVTATRARVEEAVRKNLFSRSLKESVTVPEGLAALIDTLMVKNLQGALGLSRKAGLLLTGAAKVEAAIRSGEAALVMHATDAAADGIRKMDQARKAVAMAGGPVIPALKLLLSHEMDLALGGGNVIHAAALRGPAGESLAKKARALAHYRGLEDVSFAQNGAPKETE